MWAIFAVCFDAACHEIMEEALGEATSVARRRKLRQAQRVAATRLAAPARVGARFEREGRRRAHLFAVAGGVAARSGSPSRRWGWDCFAIAAAATVARRAHEQVDAGLRFHRRFARNNRRTGPLESGCSRARLQCNCGRRASGRWHNTAAGVYTRRDAAPLRARRAGIARAAPRGGSTAPSAKVPVSWQLSRAVRNWWQFSRIAIGFCPDRVYCRSNRSRIDPSAHGARHTSGG
eukprot:COSAG06_NODE_872_length_11850_cov_8.563952_10_plen_234_part_00